MLYYYSYYVGKDCQQKNHPSLQKQSSLRVFARSSRPPRPSRLPRRNQQEQTLGQVQLCTRPIIQDPRFVSIYGVQETNYTLQPQLNDDPYEHIRDKPFFSFERLVYNDPWFHEDSHEPYNSPPRRGYIVGDDPLESRFMLSYAMYIAAGISLLVVGLYALGDKDLKNSEASLYDTYISSKYVHETLEAKNKRLNELRAKENALLRASSGAKKEVSAEKE
jgi:hypothetical protein